MHIKLLSIAFLSLLSFVEAHSQTIIHVDTARYVIDKKTINYYNLKAKDRILNVSKYIDTSKKIWIIIGDSPFGVMLNQLKAGYSFSPLKTAILPFIPESDKVITLTLVKGKLKISSEVDAWDLKYVVIVKDNKIIPSKKDYHIYASDRYFEIFDDYHVPALQIELLKKENSIYVGGAFNFPNGYAIISKQKGIVATAFGGSRTPTQKDNFFIAYLQEAKKILPIHE